MTVHDDATGISTQHPTTRNPSNLHIQRVSASKQGLADHQDKTKLKHSNLQTNHQKVLSRSKSRTTATEENRTTVTHNSSSTWINENVRLGEDGAAQNLTVIIEALVNEKKYSDVSPSVDNASTFSGEHDKSKSTHINSDRTFIPKLYNLKNPQKAMAKVSQSERTEFPLPSVYNDIHQNQVIRYFRSFWMMARPGLGVRQTTRVTAIERRYLQSAPVIDVTSCPDELQSKVYLLSNRGKYRVGEPVSVRVDLYDQSGRIRTRGGDQVRIWMKHRRNSVPARVYDLKNGSYIGESTLRWPGNASVLVSLTYPREFLRLLVELRQMVLTTRYITAVYKNADGELVEATPCLPSAPIPGYAATCNLTEENGLAPWFCGQPISANLSCSSPYVHSNLPFYKPLPLQGEAQNLSNLMNKKDDLRLIPNRITIQTMEGYTSPPLPPCWSRPRRETWELDWHQGWLDNGQWRADGCRLPAKVDADLLQRCLANTTLLLMGDSNSRKMFSLLLASLGFRQLEHWHKPFVQEVSGLNSTIAFVPHARPFNPGGVHLLRTLSTSRLFPHLPPGPHYLLVLHYWVHFVFYPLSVFRDRLRQVKRSIRHFLRQHPTAKVFLRGPHVLYGSQGSREQRGDQAGPWMIEILKAEFRDLYDQVWFLDFWPMTLASENRDIHPPKAVVAQMLRVLFGYACETS